MLSQSDAIAALACDCCVYSDGLEIEDYMQRFSAQRFLKWAGAGRRSAALKGNGIAPLLLYYYQPTLISSSPPASAALLVRGTLSTSALAPSFHRLAINPPPGGTC
jgi:hypothetical protein